MNSKSRDFKKYAVIFDMDGLLLDTESLAITCWMEAAKQEGYTLPRQAVIDTIGLDAKNSKDTFYRYAEEGFDYDHTRKIKNDLMVEHIDQYGAQQKQGAKACLKTLQEAGYKLAVATSTQMFMGKKKLMKSKLYDYFDVRVYGDEIKNGKPAPDIFLEATRQLKHDPEYCIVLEDSPAGLKAAKAAGMTAILIPDLKQPDDEMEKDADHIFENLQSACDFIMNCH